MGEWLELDVRVEPGRKRPHVARRGEILTVFVPAAAARPCAPRSSVGTGGAPARRSPGASTRRPRASVASYTTLQIRGQQTRWASCSTSGAMSFNWRLLLAPAEVLDYVVEHEVAHLDVHDHSARFWNLLAERCPRAREHERWLRTHGPLLQL